MSDPVSALGGAHASGFAEVEEIGPLGMITLRGALSSKVLAGAVKGAFGLGLPAARRIVGAGDRFAAWMSPDELLLVMPYAEVAAVLTGLAERLQGEHAMAVDVSDARAVFRVRGARAREVLAKLSPVDLAPGHFDQGEVRRTRAAQVACAFWMSGEQEFTLVAFRSVAAYVFGLLRESAASGGEAQLFPI